jgi:hypothetical protein
MKKLLLLTFIFCIALPWSCKKYEEDDYWFTLRTPLNRIKGTKRLVEATYNGENLLPIYRNIFGPHYFEFTDESLVKGGERYYIYIRDSTTNNRLCQGWWHLNFDGEKNTSFVTYFNNDEYIKNSCLGEPDTNQVRLINGGKIIKLSKSQFWSTLNLYYPNGSNLIFNLKFEKYEN